jgi:hypothetical protein
MPNNNDPNPSEFPVTVAFHFRSEAARRQFIGGLSNGWGEMYCGLDWICRNIPNPPDLGDAADVFVTSSFPDEEDDDE